MRAIGLHREWECKWQPGDSPNRFMEESLLAVIKTSTRFKLPSANKICNCKTTTLQWNFPLQDVKRERKKHCCAQGGHARLHFCPLGLDSPSLTPRVTNIPLLYVLVGLYRAGKCSDSLSGLKRSSRSDYEGGIWTKCQQVVFYLQFLGLLHTIKSLLLLQTLQFLFSWSVKLFHQQTPYKLSMTSLEDLWFLSSLNSHF